MRVAGSLLAVSWVARGVGRSSFALAASIALAACGTTETGDEDERDDVEQVGATDADAAGAGDGAGDGEAGDEDAAAADALPGGDTGGTDGPVDDSGGGEDGGDEDVPPDPQPGGGDCMTDEECPSRTFCETRFGPGYCAPVGFGGGQPPCGSDRDCVFEDSDDLFCCAALGDSTACVRAGDPESGATCGGGMGEQGESCVIGNQSDCLGENHYCIFSGEDYAYCSQFCDPRRNDCPGDSYCFETGSGFGLCLEYGETESYEPCSEDPTACEEGAFCIEAEDANPYAYCAHGCETDADCPGGSACTAWNVCQPAAGGEVGDSCVEDRFSCGEGQFCLYFGTRVAECNAICASDADCPEGRECEFFDGTQGVCTQPGDRGNGEFCGDDPFACDGYCTGGYDRYDPGAYCVAECDTDRDCPRNAFCEEFPGSGSYCMPSGDETQGGSCVTDPFACAAGHFCVDYGTADAYCAEGCSSNADCAAGTWCTAGEGEDGACIPWGDIPAGERCEDEPWGCEEGAYCAGWGEQRCFTTCTDDPEGCPDGHICLDPNENGVRWCYPTGEIPVGGACHDDPYGCEYPAFCDSPENANARCALGCSGDAECPEAEWCWRGPDGGVCRPAGDVGELASCEGDIFSCQDDLVCLLGGANGAFCSRECTGFASTCGDDMACRFVGWARSFCMRTGDRGHGETCADDQFACNGSAWCVNAGTDDAVCVQTCSFDADGCPDGTSCRFLSGGLGVCISAGLAPDDPLNPGGSPF